jgi:membrane protease YdiL (CAAX protease family)
MPQKIKSSLEIFAGLVFVFGYLWIICPVHSLWVQVLFAIPVFLFFIYSDFIRGKSSFQDLGLRLDNWYGSFKILFVFTLIAIPLLYLIWQPFFPVNNLFYKESSLEGKFVNKAAEALFQQYIFLVFFFRRYREIFAPRTHVAVILSALTFAMIHIPNPPLVILCFAAGIVWAYTYNKYPNLFTIAISHAVLGVFCTSVLLVYQIVGPNADIGRWSQESKVSVYGYIDRVDQMVPYKNHRVLDVEINRGKKSILVEGWVASSEKIKKIRISLGGREYSVHYGDKMENIASYFNNPDFLHSGFSVIIPVSDYSPGYHRLFLKVYLEGEIFYHTPGEKIWVNLI